MGSVRTSSSPKDGIRFRIDGSRPLLIVKVCVNGKGPFNFILDTGASLSVISPEVLKRAGPGGPLRSAKAFGATGSTDVKLTRIGQLRIGTVAIADIEVAVMDLDALSRTTRRKLGGIIGYNVLRRYRITIDYPKGVLFLRRPRSAVKPARLPARVHSRAR